MKAYFARLFTSIVRGLRTFFTSKTAKDMGRSGLSAMLKSAAASLDAGGRGPRAVPA